MTVDAKVLILTPMKSAARYLDGYFSALAKLTYPRAHLSLGKLDQAQNHHREALSEFGEVAKHFPKSAQAPAALLCSSDSFAALNMADASKLALEALIKDYAHSPEAKIAHARLHKATKKSRR